MTHYLMNGNVTACGESGDVAPATRAKALISCPACLACVTRWTDAHVAAKAAWAERTK
jgi:predicted nucleic acid-binding Zn ribbon protein